MMAFFPLFTSQPVFLPLLPSGARALSPRARVRLNRLLLHPFLARHTRPLGRIPFPFLTSRLPSFLHLLLISLLSSRLFLFLPPSSHSCLRFLRHFTLFFFTFFQSHSAHTHTYSLSLLHTHMITQKHIHAHVHNGTTRYQQTQADMGRL